MKIHAVLILFALSANCHANRCETKDINIQESHYTGNVTTECAVCTDLTLNEILSIDNRRNLSCLLFQESAITSIVRYAFSSLSALEVLFLDNVGLRVISSGGFDGLRSLKRLFLQNNDISYIPIEAFQELEELKHLDLSNNSIVDLDDISLNGLERLEELILSNNQITDVKASSLSPVPNLRVLDLSHNKIRRVSGDLFRMVPKLQKLIINNNLIPVIPRQMFSNAISLTVLDISHNNIKNFNFQSLPNTLYELYARYVNGNAMTNWANLKISKIIFEGNSLQKIEGVGEKVTDIDLSNNDITTITATVFEDAVDLVNLNLSRNEIENIDANAFKYTMRLQTLYLAHNEIKNIPIGTFKTLYYLRVLDLSGNKLSQIDTYGSFSGLINLSTLSLHDNEISYILETVFRDMINIRSLDISKNQLATINAEDLVKALPSMNLLALDDNDWSCAKLTELRGYFESQGVQIFHNSESAGEIPCKKDTRISNNWRPNASNISDIPIDQNVLEMYEDAFLNSDFFKFFNSKMFTPEYYERIFIEMYKQTKLFKRLEKLFPKSTSIGCLKNVFNHNACGKQCTSVEETSEWSVEEPATAPSKKKALTLFIVRMKKGILWKLIS